MVDLSIIVDEGLGNSAYLLDLGDGRAVAVDVGRDLREVHRVADRQGLRIAYAAVLRLPADRAGRLGKRARGAVLTVTE